MNQRLQSWSRWPTLPRAIQHFHGDQSIPAYQTISWKKVCFFFFSLIPFVLPDDATQPWLLKAGFLSRLTVTQHCHLLHLTCLFIDWCWRLRGWWLSSTSHSQTVKATIQRVCPGEAFSICRWTDDGIHLLHHSTMCHGGVPESKPVFLFFFFGWMCVSLAFCIPVRSDGPREELF